MESHTDDPKRSCCSKTRCSVIVLVLLLVSVAVVSVVTFVADVRSKVQYDTSKLEWWKKTPVYQIYPRSFKDSNGDGVGDLKGIREKLPYLSGLGVEAVWISPFYKSPMADFGYDVSNYMEVDPLFGTMEDFDELLEEAKEKNIKIIIDFVPNHTSNESQWFIDSVNRVEGYEDFYVWVNGTEGTPPNNWMNAIGNSAWEWNVKRQQYYYHNYLIEQPDLNYRNPLVRTAVKEAMKFWLDKGVAGFRLDAVSHLFETENLHDEEIINGKQIKNETINLPGIFPLIQEWKQELDSYSNPPRMMFAEINMVDADTRQKYYDAGTIPFNFDLLQKISTTSNGANFSEVIQSYMSTLRTDDWPNFVTGSHDVSRVATRLGRDRARAMGLLLLTLPGTPVIYYGEEIGMTDVTYTFEESKDTFGTRLGKQWYKNTTRDPERSPMQWTSAVHAGFTNVSASPWLHVSPDSQHTNVQLEEKDPDSMLCVYKSILSLRKYASFETNTLEFGVVTPDVISYVRHAPGWQAYLIILNLGSHNSTRDFSAAPVYSTHGTVAMTTHTNFRPAVGQSIDLTSVRVGVNEGVVIAVTYQKH